MLTASKLPIPSSGDLPAISRTMTVPILLVSTSLLWPVSTRRVEPMSAG